MFVCVCVCVCVCILYVVVFFKNVVSYNRTKEEEEEVVEV